MKKIKLTVSALIAALVLSVAAPTPKAEAGIILTPVGVGLVVLIVGIIRHNPFLIVLDADGNLSQASLESNFAREYGFIDNQDVIHNLASLVRIKGGKAEPEKSCDDKTGKCEEKKIVHLTSAEVLDILAPTGLADLQPEAVQALIKDLE